MPDAEKIYDQQFRKSQDVSLLEVTWYDGTVRCYSAADGTLLSEEKKAAPDRDLEEEFETKAYRIHSSLHEAPKVYDAKTGKYKGTLEEDAYPYLCKRSRGISDHAVCKCGWQKIWIFTQSEPGKAGVSARDFVICREKC